MSRWFIDWKKWIFDRATRAFFNKKNKGKNERRLKIQEEKPLTEKQKARIYNRIGMAMMYNDPLIEEVIERDFGGNEELYLRTMAWPEDLKDD